MQLSRLCSDFIRYKAARGGAPRTAENYELAFGQFRAFLTSKGLDDDIRNFTGDEVAGFVEYLNGLGVKANSTNTKLAALSSLGDYGLKIKTSRGKYVLSENPVSRVERPKPDKPHERYLYAQEIRDLLAVSAPAYERLALRLLLDTQLRASAAAKARVRDLSQDGERLLLHVVEKGGRHDTVELPLDLAEALLAVLKQREAGPDDPLLVNSKGVAYTRTSLSEMIARLARRAGITRLPVRAHLLARHSPASLAGQAGATEFEIAAMLRHASTATARRYVHGVAGETARRRVRELLK
jgi:site-specific recombinase XerD